VSESAETAGSTTCCFSSLRRKTAALMFVDLRWWGLRKAFTSVIALDPSLKN
jgi:hypothetical protein